MTDSSKHSKVNIEWENRVLCSDESCIGVVGPDGRCKECGLPYEGEFAPVAEVNDYPDSEDDMPEALDEFPEEEGDDPGDSDWENRTLCVDESCIGVIGPDGRCKECGKPLTEGDG